MQTSDKINKPPRPQRGVWESSNGDINLNVGALANHMKNKHWGDDETELLLIIPDLEDDNEDDIINQVAEPPAIQEQKLKSLTEMGKDNRYFSRAETGIDLSLLNSALCPDERVLEQDVPWDYELIFQELLSEGPRGGGDLSA